MKQTHTHTYVYIYIYADYNTIHTRYKPFHANLHLTPAVWHSLATAFCHFHWSSNLRAKFATFRRPWVAAVADKDPQWCREKKTWRCFKTCPLLKITIAETWYHRPQEVFGNFRFLRVRLERCLGPKHHIFEISPNFQLNLQNTNHGR